MHVSLPKQFPLLTLASSVCWSLQYLISALTQGAQWWSLLLVFFFGGRGARLFSRALGRDEHCKQISLACAHSDSATLGLPPLSMCAFPVFTAQTLGCSARNYLMQAVVCMHFPGLSCSGSGSLVLHKGTDLVGPVFAPVPGLRSSGDQFLGACSRPQLKAVTYPLPSPSGSVFWVYNGRALCLFWEADLWLRPSW